MNKFYVGSFYTVGTPYQYIYQDYLLKSCKKFNLKNQVFSIPSLGNWLLNVAEKPRVIGEMLDLLNEKDECLVFLDADSSIEQYPTLFEAIPNEYDIAYHTLNWNTWYGYKDNPAIMELLSGTLFLRNRKKVKELCSEWYKIAKNTNEWEQKILQKIIENYDLKVYPLPLDYCFIDSRPGNKLPLISDKNVVIRHFQMSRKLKKIKL